MGFESQGVDRYVSFDGLDCDQRAQRLVAMVREHIALLGGQSHWYGYFQTKLAEAKHRGHDELFFVGSQVNALRELFATAEDPCGNDLLEALEEECC